MSTGNSGWKRKGTRIVLSKLAIVDDCFFVLMSTIGKIFFAKLFPMINRRHDVITPLLNITIY
jgi:hypothetical protein